MFTGAVLKVTETVMAFCTCFGLGSRCVGDSPLLTDVAVVCASAATAVVHEGVCTRRCA